MLYETATAKPREIYNLLIGLVAPRPIALITSHDEHGQLNARPLQRLQLPLQTPPALRAAQPRASASPTAPAPAHPKDTAHNIRRTGEFVGERRHRRPSTADEHLRHRFPLGYQANSTWPVSKPHPPPRSKSLASEAPTPRWSASSTPRSKSATPASSSDASSPCTSRTRFVDPGRPLHQGRGAPRDRTHERAWIVM